MSTNSPDGTASAMLHPELLAHEDRDAIYRGGRRLDHAEGTS